MLGGSDRVCLDASHSNRKRQIARIQERQTVDIDPKKTCNHKVPVCAGPLFKKEISMTMSRPNQKGRLHVHAWQAPCLANSLRP